MNSKSFIFGKNYDSDYLEGKRLKRKSFDQRNDVNFRRIRRKRYLKVNKVTENPKTVEKSRKYMVKTFDNRITLKANPNTSTESYHKNLGLFANGKASDVVHKEWLLNDKKQSNARIKGDLFWILRQKKQNKREVTEDIPSKQPKTRPSLRHKPVYAEKETQMNSVISFDTKSSNTNMKSIHRNDNQIYRSYDWNQTIKSIECQK